MAQAKLSLSGALSGVVVLYSGGIGSWAAAKRLAAQGEVLTLLFTDTMTEDEDTYRFLRESAANVGAELIEIADGRNIWEVFRDERFLGNTRADPCSRVLKRGVARKWISEHCSPSAVVALGIDWTEIHRVERARKAWAPLEVVAPLCDPPYLSKANLIEWSNREGLATQRLYRMGMSHANCGGGCAKAGHGHSARLLAQFPERFGEWERKEEELRGQLGDVAILRDRTGAPPTLCPFTSFGGGSKPGKKWTCSRSGAAPAWLEPVAPRACRAFGGAG
ncbi:MAG: hypothetical protein GY719_26025 [bacterium]|nr:hypothetical protein [bacterium]